ncbi:hypothetical protein [Burkholderia plantarii]|uniref:hypothetical protein n=1 Tax=Burkholderia plantarii TaxID=41899 RepID=UPI0018DB7B22|nr:hypothetical protein [Burkholderia plantarii]MBI0331302.1 hypothetical protein [Burkholderia plantarii]
MSFEHRGFRVSTDVLPDDTGTQWHCSAKIHGVDDAYRDTTLPPIELTIPRTKIDVLMAISMVEQRARDSIDEWLAQQ